jgi:hypothetical protein
MAIRVRRLVAKCIIPCYLQHTQGPLSSDQTRQCMCWRSPTNTECFIENPIGIEINNSIAEYSTLEKVLELDQKLSHLHSAMMECSTCSSDPMRAMALLHELDTLCTLYVAGQAKFATSNTHISRNSNGGPAELGDSTFQIGRFVLDNEESKVVGRIIVKQGLDHLQKKLLVVQAEQKRGNSGPMHDEIGVKVRAILSKVWEASAYGCL